MSSWLMISIAEQIQVVRQLDRRISHLLQCGDLLMARISSKATVDSFKLHRGVDRSDNRQCMARGRTSDATSIILEVLQHRLAPLHDDIQLR